MRLDAAIEEFVQYKRALGNLYIGSANILKAFLRQTGNLELNALTNLHCEAFLPQRGSTATNMWFQRYAVLDRFFRYAAGRGYMYHRVLPTTFPERPPQFVPVSYTHLPWPTSRSPSKRFCAGPGTAPTRGRFRTPRGRSRPSSGCRLQRAVSSLSLIHI